MVKDRKSNYSHFPPCMLSWSVRSYSLQSFGLYPARLLSLWDFSGKNTGVGCHFLLQGIFLTQGSSSHLLLGRWILRHLGSPFIDRAPVLGNLCTHCMVTSAGQSQHVAWCLLHSRWFPSGKKEARGSCVFSPGCESSWIPWRRSLAVTVMFYDQFSTYPMRC